MRAFLLLTIAAPSLFAAPPQVQSLGVDLSGHPATSLTSPGTRAVVLLFLATDCPISNRYQPALALMAHEFARDPVRLWIVYPNPGETASDVAAHQRAFAQPLPALLDPTHSLVHLAGARITPEAAVFVPGSGGLRLVYRGRIDDRYLSLDKQRPHANRHELSAAVHAVLTGAPVQPPAGPAVGCAIVPLP